MSKQMFLFLIIFFSVGSAFFFGLLTAHYQWFPYAQLQSVKSNVFENENIRQTVSPYYLDKITLHSVSKSRQFDVFFIGDSLIDNADWQEFFPEVKVANRGIQGDTTTGVLARLKTVNLNEGVKVFLMIGINDLLRGFTVETTFENYQALTNKLIEQKIPLYIQSCLLVGETRKSLNLQVNKLNTLLQGLANVHPSIHYIDLNRVLSTPSQLKSQYTHDDLHLNGAGYIEWRDAITSYVE